MRKPLKALVLAAAFAGLGTRCVLAICDNFRRGDANSDGSVDLGDAVATLLHLFAGSFEPTCKDAVDSDDSGKIELTDAVYTLSYLFLGAKEPPAPGPVECGREDTFDDLECESYAPCALEQTQVDFSGFTTFELRQDPGFGFCPDIERLYRTRIVKDESGKYFATLTTLREGVEGIDECLPRQRFLECYVPEEEPARELTAAEAELLRSSFRSVPTFQDPDPICNCIAIDPCRVTSLTWDEQELSAFICAGPRVAEESAQAIADVLETLRPIR